MQEIISKVQKWVSNTAIEQNLRDEIQSLLENKNYPELHDRFYKDLEFGTAGMRGIVAAGTNRLNSYNIKRICNALAMFLIETYKNEKICCAITYDSRTHSKLFAEICTGILTTLGITVYLTENMRPVPFLSYIIRQNKCHAGICITASHNPTNYNGFKVYNTHGAQIIPPWDEAISSIYRSEKPLPTPLSLPNAYSQNLLKWVKKDTEENYLRDILNIFSESENQEKLPTIYPKILYTPLHGTGIFMVPKILEKARFNIDILPSQKDPDGTFPTVQQANPEDPSSFELALEYGKNEDYDLIFATDPDCDRLGIFYLTPQGYVRLGGNESLALLCNFVLQNSSTKKNTLVIKSIVTSELLDKIAAKHQAKLEITLTGFKWICSRIEEYEIGTLKPYHRFICGGEEAFGFLAGLHVRDKDAVCASLCAAKMGAFYKSKGQNLGDAIRELHIEHGIFYEDSYSEIRLGSKGQSEISKVMHSLRTFPPKTIGEMQIIKIVDFLDEKTSEQGHKLPKSDLLQFYFDENSRIQVRPSGTEPKIKFYLTLYKRTNTQKYYTDRGELEIKMEILKNNIKKILNSI